MPIRAFALAVFLAVLSATGAAQAQPHSEWDDFDCGALIGPISPPGSASSGNAVDTLLELVVPEGTEIPQRQDPVSVDELLGPDGTPLEIRSRSEVPNRAGSDPLYLSCVLIVVEFFETETSNIFNIRDKITRNLWQRMPVLLVRITSSPSESSNRFTYWREEKNYSIPMEFPEFGDARNIDIAPGTLRVIRFLQGSDWNDRTARFIRFQPLQPDVEMFLGASGAGDAHAMMVLCEQYDCDDIANTVRNTISQEQVLPPDREADDTGKPDCEPEPPDAIGTCRVVTLAFRGATSGENAENLDTLGDLACILSVIDPDIFRPPPDCSTSTDAQRAREELAELNPVIRIAEDGRWLIVAGSSDADTDIVIDANTHLDPVQVVVTLPEGETTDGCRLDLEYSTDEDQFFSAPLHPETGSDPATFVASIDNGTLREGDDVRLRIIVDSPAQCGGPTREVTVSAAEVIPVPLVPGERTLRAVAHILPVNRDRFEIDLEFDEAGRFAFVRAALGALEAAHARLAAAYADRAWPLVLATVSGLDGEGRLFELASLNATTLRRPTTEGFAEIEGQYEALMENRATPSRQSLANALTPLLEATDRREIDHLTIILVAPPSQRSTEGLTHPCSDPRYRDLAADLAQIGGPQVQVVVFPLIGLSENDAPDLSVLVPLGFDPAAPTLPGGLYACRNTPPGMEIYPFFVEPWRARVEVAPRYATALSDQLAGILATLLSEGEPIR